MILLICTTAVVGLLLYWCMQPFFSVVRHIPEPKRWPLLQYNVDFIRTKDKLPLLRKWACMFKDGIFKVNFPKLSTGFIINIIKPEHMRYVLGNPGYFERTGNLKKLFPLMGDGILTSSGKAHAFQKKLMAKAFSVDHIKLYVPRMNHHARRLIERWVEKIGAVKEGKNLEVQEDCSNAVFDIFCDTGFGHHYDALNCNNDVVRVFKEQVDTVTDLGKRFLYATFSFEWLKYFKINILDFSRAKTKRCEEIVEDIIAKKREILSDDSEFDRQTDLLSMLMKARDDETNTGFTDKLLRDNVITLMVASFETTGCAIPWVLYMFAMNLDAQVKARGEINTIMRGREEFEPGDISRMTFFNACVKEALRLHSPIPFVFRKTKQKCSIGGYEIPPNTAIMGNIMSNHRVEETYERADEFLPERFLNGSGASVAASYTTFGYGPYSCIGQHFAMVEIKVLVMHLLRKFHFTADPEFRTYETTSFITIKARPQLTLRLTAVDV